MHARILSVFNLLKRVGFVFLLLCSTMVEAQPVWQEIYRTNEDLPYCHMYNIFFTSPDSGFMGGHCPHTLFRTTDGGLSWTPLWEMSGEGLNGVNELLFRNNTQGIITFGGVIAHTFNGGDTWDYTQLPESVGVADPAYIDSATLISAGSVLADPEQGPWIAQIRKSTDAGYTWSIVFERSYGFLDGLIGGTVLSASGTLIVSRDLFHVLRSIDQGETWEDIGGTHINQATSCASPDSGKFIVCGGRFETDPNDSYPAISRSADDGLTWELVWADSSGNTRGGIGDVSFGDSLHGSAIIWEALGDYYVLHTSDGGVTWTPDTLDLGLPSGHGFLMDLHMLRADLGWIAVVEIPVPSHSRILRYADTTASNNSAHYPDIPSDFEISVFPNPFNSTLSISLDVPLHLDVTLGLYDLLGREVDVIYRGRLDNATLAYTASPSLASGIYFLRAATATQTQMQKVVLLK